MKQQLKNYGLFFLMFFVPFGIASFTFVQLPKITRATTPVTTEPLDPFHRCMEIASDHLLSARDKCAVGDAACNTGADKQYGTEENSCMKKYK